MTIRIRIEKVWEALNGISDKKESLRQAFLQLERSHSSSLSSFSLSWPEIDSHFSSIESSLRSQFHSAINSQKPITQTSPPCPDSNMVLMPDRSSSGGNGTLSSRQVRPELRDLCERVDGRGLRRYIDEHHKELNSIKEELSEALRFASDPALMVLDAVDDFYKVDMGLKGKDVGDILVKEERRTCVTLLEKLMSVVGAKCLSGYVKEKATNLAMEWMGKVRQKDSDSLRALGFLTLLATYNLRSEFDENEIVEILVKTAQSKEAVNLCRMLIMPDKIKDVVQKLIEAEKTLLAVKFICEFALAEKFPPVPLLKAYVNDIKKSAKSIRDKGNHSLRAMNEASVKEVNALKTVLNYIEDHKLESEYPPKILENRIKKINSKKSNKKRSAADMVNGKMQQQYNRQPKNQQSSVSNRSHSTGIATPTTAQTLANVHSSMRPYQPAHLPTAASSTVTPFMILNPDVSGFSGSNRNVVQYLGNQDIASYSGSTPTVNPYASSVVGLHSTAGGTVVHPAKLSPKSSIVYMSEPPLPSAYYSTATAYGGGYNVPPQYHPQYYPQ